MTGAADWVSAHPGQTILGLVVAAGIAVLVHAVLVVREQRWQRWARLSQEIARAQAKQSVMDTLREDAHVGRREQ
jgi:multisubunit Na+/H+ antiporter MnhE subunit